MGDHSLFEKQVDDEPPTEAIDLPALPPALAEQLADPKLGPTPGDVSRVIEVKVVVSAVASLVVSIVLAWLNAVQASPGLLAALQPWAQFLIITAIPPTLTFAAGYLQPSNRV